MQICHKWFQHWMILCSTTKEAVQIDHQCNTKVPWCAKKCNTNKADLVITRRREHIHLVFSDLALLLNKHIRCLTLLKETRNW
jgi:hypothetical protein